MHSQSDYIQTNEVHDYLAAHEGNIMPTISELQRRVGEVNVANGWRETPDLAPEMQVKQDIVELALITTEVSEAIEELRVGYPSDQKYYSGSNVSPYNPDESHNPDGTLRKPEGVRSELADIVIRALDFADKRGIDLESDVLEKLEYNATRGYRHGGKVA